MRERSVVVWVVLAAVLLAVLNLPASVSQRVKSVLREGLAPLQQAVTGVTRKLSETGRAIRGIGDMADENRLMAAELVYLRNEVRDLKPLEEENLELRRQLEFTRRSPRKLIACEVIARDISGWWHTIRLNRGTGDGVVADMAVVTLDGLVGKTIQVSSRTADVLLISDPSCRVSARIARTGSFGVVVGTGETGGGRVVCVMEFMNKNVPILEGDEVLTSGLGGVFPKGLLIGYVERVYRDEAGLFQRADVVPKADLGVLTYVFAVQEEGQEIDDYLRRQQLQEGGPR